MNQQETIAAIQAADINEHDWWHPIIETIDSGYARGYLTAKNEQFLEYHGSGDESYREELLRVCSWNIWK